MNYRKLIAWFIGITIHEYIFSHQHSHRFAIIQAPKYSKYSLQFSARFAPLKPTNLIVIHSNSQVEGTVDWDSWRVCPACGKCCKCCKCIASSLFPLLFARSCCCVFYFLFSVCLHWAVQIKLQMCLAYTHTHSHTHTLTRALIHSLTHIHTCAAFIHGNWNLSKRHRRRHNNNYSNTHSLIHTHTHSPTHSCACVCVWLATNCN